MKNAYKKDIWRTIKRSKKRFFAILIITMLGVTMLTGLKAGCVDLRYSADAFYDQQNLYDIQIVSTLGLNDKDIQVLSNIEAVDDIEGAYQETVYVQAGDAKQSVSLKTLSRQGLNAPYIIAGELPTKENEIAVSEKYLRKSGKELGDTLVISNSALSSSSLKVNEFIIVAKILDPMNVSVDEGATSFRSTSTVEDTFFVLPEAFSNTIYTAIYMTLQDSRPLLSYSEAYEARVKEVVTYIEEQIKGQQEQARYDEVIQKASQEYQTSRQTVEQRFGQAEEQFDNVQKQLQNAMGQIQIGKQEIQTNEAVIAQQKTNSNKTI